MAKSLTIADLIYKLGFAGEEEFVAGLESVLKKGEKQTEQSGKKAGEKGGRASGKGFSDQFKATFSGAALGSFLGTALTQAFAGAVGATTRFVNDSIREYSVYEQGLLQLKLAGETNLAALSKRIQDTAKATKVFSATDVSLAVGELVKAGYDAETAFALVETGALGAASEVDAATGKFGDLSATAGSLGNILRALGYDTAESGRVMDVLARAAQDSNLNVSDLVDIVSRVGPTAKLAGLEIEDLAAMAAVLSNNGMEASTIGTGLRTVLLSLINPTGNVKAELESLGVSLVDEQGNLRNFSEVLDGLHELTERGGTGLQTLASAMGSFGIGVASSLGTGSEAVKDFTQNMHDAEGTAKSLADTMRNSAAGAAAEMEARIKDAKAALGEQMMPILLSLNETVLPVMVRLLGDVIQKWTDWQFIITGTTTAIQQSQAALQATMVDKLGQELADAINAVVDAQQRASDAQRALDSETFNYGAGHRRRAAELAAAQEELAAAQARLEVLREQRKQQQLLASWDGGAGTPFGPLGEGQSRPQAVVDAANAVAAAYRNLQTVEAELAEARSKWAAAGSADEEARWAAEVKRLEAEKRAKEAAVKTAEATAAAVKTATKDPLVDEAQRVQADLQRLKLAFEQGKLDLDQYTAAQEAHLRRLDGLYERAASPEQSLAVLRARKVFLDELGRLSKAQADADAKAAAESEAALQRIVDAWQEYADSRKAAQASIDDAAAERAARREEHAMLKVVNAWKAYAQSLKDAQALQEAEAARDSARTARREETALRRVVEAHNEYTASLKEAARLQEENAARIAARQTAKEAGQLQLVVEAHKQYVESLKEAARIEAERAEAQARADRAAKTRQSLANLFPGAAGNSADSYVTLADRAAGAVAKLTEAQRALGVAGRDEVQAALEGQISAINRLLVFVEEGTDRYYDLVDALVAAKAALTALQNEIPDATAPKVTNQEELRAAQRLVQQTIAGIQQQIAAGPDQATLALLEQRLVFFQALLQAYDQAARDFEAAAASEAAGKAIQGQAEQMAGELMDVAKAFPLALVEGIKTGDIGSALEDALGGAADYFLNMMLEAILGPITKELTASIAASLAAQQAAGAAGAAGSAAGGAGALGALGPIGLVLGGLALVASVAMASSKRKEQTKRTEAGVRSAVSGAPSITYNLAANVNVSSNASWSDPAFQARWRAETEALVISLLSKVRRS